MACNFGNATIKAVWNLSREREQALFNSETSACQADDACSIPAARSRTSFPTHYLQKSLLTFVMPLKVNY